jgi:creatinase
VLFTSYHCINSYADFLFCYFGRRYGFRVDHTIATSISAGLTVASLGGGLLAAGT